MPIAYGIDVMMGSVVVSAGLKVEELPDDQQTHDNHDKDRGKTR